MGSGKTTIGRALAKKLNMRFLDADHEVEARTGVSIPVIFDIEGEASFRQREAEAIRDLTAQHGLVLATGGGAVLNAESRRLLRSRGTVIYLRASVSHILQRTSHDKNRPLLRTDNPRRVLEELSALRDPLYQEISHHIIDTGRPNVAQLVQSILLKLAIPILSASRLSKPMQSPSVSHLINVALGDRSYPICIAPDALTQIAAYVPQRYLIVTNTTVAPLYLEQLSTVLQAAGKAGTALVLPDGEAYKTLATLELIFDALLQGQFDRKTTLIALGGGVIGDLTGFAAASYMRGVPFVQVPTTLLSQVDSAVGGKTGVNHPLGKNMIGAFYQPQAVLADTSTLATLPERELSAGLAEVIKYGPIVDMEFFSWLEQHCQQLRELSLYGRNRELVEQAFPGLTGRRAVAETIRRMINDLVLDLIGTSAQRIAAQQPRDIEAVRHGPALIAFSEEMEAQAAELKQFLRNNLYRHYQVQRMTSKARRCVRDLFGLFMEEPELLPPDYLVNDDVPKQARRVADYIAGMTDRYAMREHRRLFSVDEI